MYNDDNNRSHDGDLDDGIRGVDLDKEAFQYAAEGVLLTGVSIFGILGTLMSFGVLVKRDVR
jgi:hypothetical protein